MTLPNLITIGRLILVPLIIWLIIIDRADIAFWVFLIAGLSDAVDGFLARQLDLRSDLGTLLDPLADKAMLVSIYLALSYVKALPVWVVILVVSRDVFIIGAVVLSWMLGEPMNVRPHWLSKVNTVLQILLAVMVLGALAFSLDLAVETTVGIYTVAALTALSAAVYLVDWIRHMASGDVGTAPGKDQRP